MILCGLCGLQCGELHGNLTQVQRLEALEQLGLVPTVERKIMRVGYVKALKVQEVESVQDSILQSRRLIVTWFQNPLKTIYNNQSLERGSFNS